MTRETARNGAEETSKNLIKDEFMEAVRNKYIDKFDDKYPWTIYFLIDLKIVYIITYAFITVVNLISSIANNEAYSERNNIVLFNVSSDYINVNVTSINDAVLWNCRTLSENNYYYRFL